MAERSRIPCPSAWLAILRAKKPHGARWTGSACLSASTAMAPAAGRIRFNALAEHYLQFDFGTDAVRPKTERTTINTKQIVRSYLIPRWGQEMAEDIRPIELQRWLQSLHSDKGLAWTTVSKFRGTMLRVYKIGLLHELVTKNPVLPVETRSTTNYKAILVTPQQTLKIIQSLPNPLHRILVLTCAATALRASELLALRWGDMLVGGREDRRDQMLVPRKKRAYQDPKVRRPRASSFRPCFSAKGVAGTDGSWQRNRLRLSVTEGGRTCAPLPRRVCC
jgi:integrase